MSKKIVLLGSTGSIGTQCLAVCRERGFKVMALAANSNIELLEEQAREFMPILVVVANPDLYLELKSNLADTDIMVEAGAGAVEAAAAMENVDLVFNSVIGFAGLRPTLAALEAGNDLALSNKEALIAGGSLVMETAKKNGASIYPVDSEHSAIWQCLQGSNKKDLRSIILTASGGPFFGKTGKELSKVTVEQALAHPNWSMGAKITIDSATLMNKGLEFIEAMWFFDVKPEQIEIVVHKQSVLHSAVDFKDGSVIGQMGIPDMSVAIQYSMTYPDRPALPVKRLSLTDYGALTFEKPDLDTFKCLDVCINAAKQGGLVPCVANGANEKAVELFLDGKINFLQIGELVAKAVENVKVPLNVTLDNIVAVDNAAREYVIQNY